MSGKPGRACSVCIHPARAAIDAALISGQNQLDLSRAHKLSPDAISRHARRHVSAAIAQQAPAYLAGSEAGSVDLLASADGLQDRLMRLLRRAETAKDHRTALLAIREACRLLELRGRLTGEIDASGVRIAVVSGGPSSGNGDAVRTQVMGKLAALTSGQPLLIEGTRDDD